MYATAIFAVLLAITLAPQAQAAVENSEAVIRNAYNKYHNADGVPEMTFDEAKMAAVELGLREPTLKEFNAAESDRDNNETMDNHEFMKLCYYLEVEHKVSH